MLRRKSSALFALLVVLLTAMPVMALELRGFPSTPDFYTVTWRGQAAPGLSASGQGRIYFDSTANAFRVSEHGAAYVALIGAGGNAPADATYITQTVHAGLSAEQALSALATGYLKVTTGTGALASQAVPLPVVDGGTGLTATTINQLVYSSAANTIAGLATANNGVLITSGTGVPSISSTIPSATQDNITRLGTIAVPLLVSSVGPHGIGGAANTQAQLTLTGSFTGAATANGLLINGTYTPIAGADASVVQLAATLVEAGSGTHTDFIGLLLNAPTITPGAAALTNASTLKIIAAPTGATNNYALWSAAGLNRFDGNILHGASAAVGTSGAVVYAQAIGTAPTTSPADIVQQWVEDCAGAGTACRKIRDEGGNVFTIGNGTIISPGTVRTTCSTVAALPAGTSGDRKCVSDQLTTCPVLDGTFTGGGAVTCSAFYNGTAWVHS